MTPRATGPGADPAGPGAGGVAFRRVADRLLSRPVDRLLGTALFVASCNPPALAHAAGLASALVTMLAAVAWWASPMIDARPVRSSMRWQDVAVRRRTTVLPAVAIVTAAMTGPAVWLVACIALLLLAYLLATDPWILGVTAPPARPSTAGPALAAASASAVVLLAAEAPLADTAWSRLTAALAITAAAACLTLAMTRRSRR